jgi:hypothetical protein
MHLLRVVRNNILSIADSLSLEELNHIPSGYHNNIIWQMGHVLVSQQSLHYRLTGLPMLVDDEMVSHYKNGTRPNRYVNQLEVDQIKRLLLSTIDNLEDDYKSNRFHVYKKVTVGLGATLSTIEEAITFNNVHEGVHLGCIMQLQKLVSC